MNFSYRLLRKYKSLAGLKLKYQAESVVQKQWLSYQQSGRIADESRHNLPAQLILSLTSFPGRFETLHLTLKSLLLQSVRPDQIILWLYDKDIAQLPDSVKQLCGDVLSIQSVAEDSRSYKKLMPALSAFPEAFHVTADDDIYYRPDWLATLVQGYAGDQREILCWRAHYVQFDAQGEYQPYRSWQPKTEVRGPDNRLFFTSGGGVLFPPGALHSDATNWGKAKQLAPYADDLWWYWMARLNGCSIRRVGDNPKLIVWKASKKSESLWRFNKQADVGNDAQIQNLTSVYGNVSKT